jgi:stearoyl-CoA desaturase (delta-9 desaturase)
MFKLDLFWEKTFYFCTWLFQGPSFLHPSSYARMHIEHHQYSDTDKDPHSPIHEPNLYNLMIKTYKKYMSLIDDSNKTEYKTRLHFKDWITLDRFAQSNYNTFLWIGIYISVYYALNINVYYYPFILIHFFMGPIQGAIVNWAGHKFGYSNYDLGDNSKNTLPIDVLLMGELYQNNHHKNGKRINFAHRRFEIDFTYQIAKFLNRIKVIKL